MPDENKETAKAKSYLESLPKKIKENLNTEHYLDSFLAKAAFLFLVGVFLYAALWGLDFSVPEPWGAVFGIFVLSSAIALLLVADEVQKKGYTCKEPIFGEEPGVKNGHPTSYRFLTFCAQRKALVALTFLLILSGIWVIVSMISSLFTIEFSDSAGMGLRLGSQTVDFYPISPYEGWQNTRIRLKKDDSFQVEILGRVSPGHVRSLEEIRKYIEDIEKWDNVPDPKILWPFTGPEGYKDEFYEKARKGEIPELWRLPHYTKDEGLTVKGLPHNKVVGIVLPEGIEPKKEQYDWETDRSSKKPKLIPLSASRGGYPINRRAPNSGVLWVVINDATFLREDNMGQFFMTLLVK
ncbi:hypothetical protein [Candidatus Thiosymbion oneisti]|uniref:hypothetical protein n=1 Tax=Candidatus Thiosymbion oneisti TaxID=589554 RepID=UPI00105B275E|nr:hypothetical protein [Candidatus Thiosymbion oneisti]